MNKLYNQLPLTIINIMFKKALQTLFFVFLFCSCILIPTTNILAAGILPAQTGGSAEAQAACAEYLKGHPDGNCGNYRLEDIVYTAVNVSKWILGVVGSVALLFFVYGGFVFILSGGSEEKVKQGKQILIGSVVGLCIVFSSFLIIQFSVNLLGAKTINGNSLNIVVPKK